MSQNDCPTPWIILSENDCHISLWFIKWSVSLFRWLSTPGWILEAQSRIFLGIKVIIKKAFETATSWVFRSTCCSLFFDRHIYLQLLGQWWAGLDLAKIKNEDNHFGREGVCKQRVFNLKVIKEGILGWPHQSQLAHPPLPHVITYVNLHGIPSPTHDDKAQHAWRQRPNFWASRNRQNAVYIHQSRVFILLSKQSWDLCWELGIIFARPNSQHKPQISPPKVMSCRHPCHAWDLFRTQDLGPMWSGKSQLSCSQRLRLHRLSSSDLGTWDLGLHVNQP